MTHAAAPDAPRYQIGPIAFAIELDALEAWLDSAPVGDRIVYAHGRAAPSKAAAFVRAGELGRARLLRLHNRRRPDGDWEWLAIRCAAPDADDAPDAVRAPLARADAMHETVEARVLRVLRVAANIGTVCPTNAEIAQACGLLRRDGAPDPDAASYRVRKLVAAGAIRIEDFGPTQRRIVTICGSGAKTVAGAL